MSIHDLKIDPQPFADLVSGAKTCEVRNDDRGFEVGDTVRFPGGHCRTISHIQRGYGLPDGLCVLSYTQAGAASVGDDLSKQSSSGCSDERPCIPCFSHDGACQASVAPEQGPVAEVRYMGYEPANHLNWLGGNHLQLLADGTKLYTHADDGEVERLRAELKSASDIAQHNANCVGEVENKLIEAQALLRESRDAYAEAIHWEDQQPVMKKIDAFLSATGQPADGVKP